VLCVTLQLPQRTKIGGNTILDRHCAQGDVYVSFYSEKRDTEMKNGSDCKYSRNLNIHDSCFLNYGPCIQTNEVNYIGAQINTVASRDKLVKTFTAAHKREHKLYQLKIPHLCITNQLNKPNFVQQNSSTFQ